MNKDIIYIDTEDDITAIIGKVKGANERIVALVPPKSVGVLQSAVNLRLLARAAKQADKRLVLITNNAALTALAASAKLPIAKNLQSKPEIAQIPALDIDDGDDIIDGAQLPVGDLARTIDVTDHSTSAGDEAAAAIAREDSNATKPASASLTTRKKPTNNTKVPDFNKFRKKLVLIGAGLVAIIGIFVWALVFAPHATVVITARTTEESVNKKVFIGETAATNASASTLKGLTQQLKKDVSIDVVATGTKDVGEKATGQVKLKTDSTTILISGLTVPAGTQIQSASGVVFVTDSAAVFAQGNPAALNGVTVGVTAMNSGASANGASGAASTSASGVSSAAFVGSTSGGTDKTIKVVTADDIDRANSELSSQNNDAVKKQLTDQFGKDTAVLDASFKVDTSAVKPAPAIGEEAPDGKGKLAGSVTYTVMGVAKAELSTYLTSYFESQIGTEKDQRIYDNGSSKVTFTNVSESNGAYAANMSASAKIGPNISDEQVKQLAKGKRYGDVQAAIVAIQGVDNVDIKFSYFWVHTVPNDEKKISVEFNLDESK